jgi:Sugar (and other) transporter
MAKHAGTGAIVFIYFSGAGWALGWNTIQYLIGSEIFPLRVRSLGTSLIMCFHFVNQYGSSKAVPLMLLPGSLQPSGTFWFFAAVTLLGLAWTWFFLPETASKSLESMDELFSPPWYLMGRKGAKMTLGRGGVADALENGGDGEKLACQEAERVEYVENKA